MEKPAAAAYNSNIDADLTQKKGISMIDPQAVILTEVLQTAQKDNHWILQWGKKTVAIFISGFYESIGAAALLFPFQRWKSKSASPLAQLILSFCGIMQLSVRSFSPRRPPDVSVSAYRKEN